LLEVNGVTRLVGSVSQGCAFNRICNVSAFSVQHDEQIAIFCFFELFWQNCNNDVVSDDASFRDAIRLDFGELLKLFRT
jgi:hypothetical protein